MRPRKIKRRERAKSPQTRISKGGNVFIRNSIWATVCMSSFEWLSEGRLKLIETRCTIVFLIQRKDDKKVLRKIY